MKRLIRWALNHLPRTFLQRIAGISVPVLGWFYIGRGVECPVCGTRRRKFLPYGYVHSRPNALCPRCLSLERHRLLWLYLQRETDLLTAYPRILHIAPEVCLMRKLRKHYDGHPVLYLTADLESPLADMHFDVQHIPLEDDFTARRELHRILKPGGWGSGLSPMDAPREETFEDDTITDPAERTRVFGQYDHRRIYGRDYADRLRSAGFEVADIDFAASLTEAERRLYALPDDHIYVVYKVRE